MRANALPPQISRSSRAGRRACASGGRRARAARQRRPHARAQIGLTQRDVANSVLVSLLGSGQVAPNFWVDPQERRQLPCRSCRRRSTASIPSTRCKATPIAAASARQRAATARQPGARLQRGTTPAVVSHYNVQPVLRRLRQRAGPRPRRRGAAKSRRIVDDCRKDSAARQLADHARPGGEHERRLRRPGLGLVFAVVLVYLLMVVNFQCWLDPFIIIMALPGALAGIVWMLFCHAHHVQRARADGGDHVHRRGHRQQHPAGHLRQRAACAQGTTRIQRRARSRPHAPAPGAHDGAGDDHRHAADVAGAGRRRRAERAAGPRRDRRPARWRRWRRCFSCRWSTACCVGTRRWWRKYLKKMARLKMPPKRRFFPVRRHVRIC